MRFIMLAAASIAKPVSAAPIAHASDNKAMDAGHSRSGRGMGED